MGTQSKDDRVTDLAQKVGEAKKVQDDVKAFAATLKAIRVDFKDLHDSVENAWNYQPAPFSWDKIQDGFSGIAHKIVQALYEHFDPFKKVIDGLAGSPEAISRAKDHWDKDLPKSLDQQKAIADSNVGRVKDAWKGQLSESMIAVMAAENQILDALKEIAKAGVCVIGMVGKIVDAFRKFLLDVLARIIDFIAKKVMEKLTQWEYKLAGPEAGPIAAAIVTIVQTCDELYHMWKEVDQAITDVQNIIKNIKKAVTQGQGCVDDIQKLLVA